MEKVKNGISSKVTAVSLVIALGIVYGDLGTSPLYALRAVIGEREISQMLVYGGLSCIFWTLTLQTTIKYMWLTLKADNAGEGGIFSLFALVHRYGKWLVLPTIIGAAALLADGIITPAITITSAIEGLNMVKGWENTIAPGYSLTINIVIVIISALFFFQRFGTQAIGKSFGPIMTIWFLMLLTIGTVKIVQAPEILKALNPYYAYDLLTHYPKGFWLLGAVFLATTGAEAMYSDLGHCGRENIRITWVFVKISLVACYFGQGVWLMNHVGQTLSSGRNPFFEVMPNWFLLPSIIIATMAAVIAAQGLISGAYTIINEAKNLNFFPRVAVRQPTETKGQVYIPSVNIMLWVGCIFMVLFFRNSSNMEAAYGLAINIAMMVTTYLLTFFIIYRLKWKKIFVFGLLFLLGSIEITFFIANMRKFPEGGNIALLIAAVFIFVMYSVYYGRKIRSRFVKFIDFGQCVPMIKELSEDDSIPKYATHLIYLTNANERQNIEEKIIKSIFAKKPKRADMYWFLHINRTEQPYTLSYSISELVDEKVIKVKINIGFCIQTKSELYFKKIVQELIANKELNLHSRPDGSTKYNNEPDYKFVVIEKFLSAENEFTFLEGLLLNAYFLLKRLGQSDIDAFGLDKSDVVIEQTPLVYQPTSEITLARESNVQPNT